MREKYADSEQSAICESSLLRDFESNGEWTVTVAANALWSCVSTICMWTCSRPSNGSHSIHISSIFSRFSGPTMNVLTEFAKLKSRIQGCIAHLQEIHEQQPTKPFDWNLRNNRETNENRFQPKIVFRNWRICKRRVTVTAQMENTIYLPWYWLRTAATAVKIWRKSVCVPKTIIPKHQNGNKHSKYSVVKWKIRWNQKLEEKKMA